MGTTNRQVLLFLIWMAISILEKENNQKMLPGSSISHMLKEKWPKKSQMLGVKEESHLKQWESLCKGIMEKKNTNK